MNDNKDHFDKITIKQSAIIAGIGLLGMAIIAPIADFSILQGLTDSESAAKTFNNIVASEGSFRLAIMLFLIVALLDIIIAWALYIFLSPVNKGLSLLTAWLRVVYAGILVVVLIFLIKVIILINGADNFSGFSFEQLSSQVMISISLFRKGWEFALIIFGFHLLTLGYLLYRAGYMRKVLGILVAIAAIGYMVDGMGKLLSNDYNISMSMYTFIGEVILMFWLLIKGRKIERKRQEIPGI